MIDSDELYMLRAEDKFYQRWEDAEEEETLYYCPNYCTDFETIIPGNCPECGTRLIEDTNERLFRNWRIE